MIIYKTHSFIPTDDYRMNNTSKAVNSYYRRCGAESLLFRNKKISLGERFRGNKRNRQELNRSRQTKQIFATVLTLNHTLRDFIMTIKSDFKLI